MRQGVLVRLRGVQGFPLDLGDLAADLHLLLGCPDDGVIRLGLRDGANDAEHQGGAAAAVVEAVHGVARGGGGPEAGFA